jgi:3,4-dihydroxy 2-butanone 4-phosphate synthase
MMRRDECLAFGKKWGIRVCTIEDLVTYIEENEDKLARD